MLVQTNDGRRPNEDGVPVEADISSVVSGLADIFRRRFRTFVLVFLIVLVTAAVGVLLITPKYVATARLKIDPHQNAMIGIDTPSGNPDQSVIDTEVSVIQSRDIATAVVKELRLGNDPEFQPKGDTPLKPGVTRLDVATDRLLNELKVEREKSTYVVDISFRSTNGEKAARIANAFAAAYLNNSLGSRTGTASRQADFLSKRLAAANADLQRIDAQAAQYRAQAGIIGSGQAGGYSGTVADQQAATLAAQLSEAESKAAADQSKLNIARQQMAKGGIDAVSAVLQSAVVTDLRRQRAEVVRNMGEVQARYGPKHPETVKVAQQIEQIDQQIDQEARRVIGSLASEAAASSASAATLRGQMSGVRSQQSSNTRAGALAQSISQQADAQRQTVNRIATELQQVSQLSRNTQTQAQVVELAVPPDAPSYPNKKLALAFAGLIALALGFGTVAVQEVMDNGLRSVADIEGRMGIPFIASIPMVGRSKAKRKRGGINPADVLIDTPVTPFAEAFRTARSTLLLGSKPIKVLTFVSSLPDEGKSTSVLAMARVLVQSGDRVLLIDCDIRRAGLSEIVDSHQSAGLLELLQGKASFDDVLLHDKVEGLDIIPVIQPTFTPEDYFSTPEMQSVLMEARKRYDYVLIDTPPLLGVADARTLAVQADAVILLIKWDKTPLKSVRNALNWLDQDGAQLVGAMYSMVDPRSEAIGAMYYSGAYARYYQKS